VVVADQGRTDVTAREEVLTRLRTALLPGPGAPAPAPTPAAPASYRLTGEHPPGSPELLELLVDRLVDYRAQVHRTDEPGLPATLAATLAEATAGQVSGRPSVVVPDGFPAEWLGEADVEVRADDALSAAELDDLDGVVTTVAVAIAETGTLVLDGQAGQGRRAVTLVPDLHVCVVRSGQVVQTVPEAVALLEPTRPLTWISGPSATSDIELVRVEGVHGPRRLHVVLLT
jgi:L-lactate dehydrogenase complex protein LldG